MADTPTGLAPDSARETGRTLIALPTASRTRRVAGIWAIGGPVAAVYASRKAGDGQPVTLTLSDGEQQLTASMTAGLASAMAAALDDAAGRRLGGAA